MSFLSIGVNRATRRQRKELAHRIAEEMIEILEVEDTYIRKSIRKWVSGAVMLGTGLATSLLLADVWGLLDPGHFLDAFDVASSSVSDMDLTDHLKFGNYDYLVEPGDDIAGTMTGSRAPVQQFGPDEYIDLSTGQPVPRYP